MSARPAAPRGTDPGRDALPRRDGALLGLIVCLNRASAWISGSYLICLACVWPGSPNAREALITAGWVTAVFWLGRFVAILGFSRRGRSGDAIAPVYAEAAAALRAEGLALPPIVGEDDSAPRLVHGIYGERFILVPGPEAAGAGESLLAARATLAHETGHFVMHHEFPSLMGLGITLVLAPAIVTMRDLMWKRFVDDAAAVDPWTFLHCIPVGLILWTLDAWRARQREFEADQFAAAWVDARAMDAFFACLPARPAGVVWRLLGWLLPHPTRDTRRERIRAAGAAAR